MSNSQQQQPAHVDLFARHRFYHGPLGRIDAERQLKAIGYYLIRDSSSVHGDLVLSVRERSGIRHFMIKKKNGKYKIGEAGYSFEFNQLIDLINHFTSKPLNENCLSTPVEREGQSRQYVTEALGLYNFDGGAPDELRFQARDVLKILEFSTNDWWLAEGPSGQIGLIPSNFVKLPAPGQSFSTPAPAPLPMGGIPNGSANAGGDAFSAMAQRQKQQQNKQPIGPAVLPGIAMAMRDEQAARGGEPVYEESRDGQRPPLTRGNTTGGASSFNAAPQLQRQGSVPASAMGRLPPPVHSELYGNQSAVMASTPPPPAVGGRGPMAPPPNNNPDDLYQNQAVVRSYMGSDNGPPPAFDDFAPPPMQATGARGTSAASPANGAAPSNFFYEEEPATDRDNASVQLQVGNLDDFLKDQFADLESELSNVLSDFGDMPSVPSRP